jgi:predicted ATPase
MYVSRVILKNWRNFKDIDVELSKDRVFLVGPNACGKSNFLDVFRFLRDIAKEEGERGLLSAIKSRGGIPKIRSLHATRNPKIKIEIHLLDDSEKNESWIYDLEFNVRKSEINKPYIEHETVKKNGEVILQRPTPEDKGDPEQLTQTHLEQKTQNHKFREISKFFQSIRYLHLVPQLIRFPKYFSSPLESEMPEDPHGKSFMDKLAKTLDKTRKSWLRKIEKALSAAVPQLKKLTYKEERGIPHLETTYDHWRKRGARQREDQFSDGTLRLIGLLWSLLENNQVLLLEEPELSLNAEIIRKLPALMWRMQYQKKNNERAQVILSTHSTDLLLDKGIGGEEVLLLIPGKEGTDVKVSSSFKNIRILLESGLSAAEAILPMANPKDIRQLDLFK